VDWLHGSAESVLSIGNILVVLGFAQAIHEKKNSLSEEKSVIDRSLVPSNPED
jgi:Protein of unknown function (DUF3593)